MGGNLEKLKKYFDQADVEYKIWADDYIRIDFNYWVYYLDKDNTLDIYLEPSLRDSYNRLRDKGKKEFIEYMNNKFKIEIKKVSQTF